MNESAMKSLSGLLLTMLALILAACSPAAGDPPLKGATMGGPFTLTSHQGRRVSDTDFAGKYRLIYFGYSFCPDVCPVDLQTLSAGLRQFESDDPERAEKVQPIFITVDPRRDTVEALAVVPVSVSTTSATRVVLTPPMNMSPIAWSSSPCRRA